MQGGHDGSNRKVRAARSLLVNLYLSRVLVAAVLAIATAGCAGRSDDAHEVVFWAMGSEADAAESVLDGFRSSHPGIPVRVQRVPWSAAHEKLLTAYVGGSMPDVFQLGNTWVPELAILGALEPLDSRVASSALVSRDDFFAGALEPNIAGGRLVALPWYVDTRLLFYRRDLLSRAGVAEAPRNWAEWTDAMRKIREMRTGAEASPFGVFLPIGEWQTPVILALQQGASLLRDNDGRGNFSSAEVRRAWEFYTGLFRDDLAPKRSEAQVASVYREFAAGYFAFFVTGPWNLVELSKRMPAELADQWTTAPMPAPQGDGPGVSIAGGASLAVSSTSARKDSAWALVEYLSSAPVQKRFRELSGDLPSRRSAWDAVGAAAGGNARAFRIQLDHLAVTPKIPEWERIASKITLHLEKVVREETDLDRALAALDGDVDAILEKRRALAAGQAPAAAGEEGAR